MQDTCNVIQPSSATLDLLQTKNEPSATSSIYHRRTCNLESPTPPSLTSCDTPTVRPAAERKTRLEFSTSPVSGASTFARSSISGVTTASKNPVLPRSHFCPLCCCPPIGTMGSVQNSSPAASWYHSPSNSPRSGKSL